MSLQKDINAFLFDLCEPEETHCPYCRSALGRWIRETFGREDIGRTRRMYCPRCLRWIRVQVDRATVQGEIRKAEVPVP